MAEIIEDIEDLIKQATEERSHNYTANVLIRARGEIMKVRRERDAYLRMVGDICALVPIPEVIKTTGTTADLVAWLKKQVDDAQSLRSAL